MRKYLKYVFNDDYPIGRLFWYGMYGLGFVAALMVGGCFVRL